MVCTTEQYDTILNIRPRWSPTPVFMNDQSINEHVRAGRNVEVSHRLCTMLTSVTAAE